MKIEAPFSLYKRNNSYYVRFKKNGGYTSAKSTGEVDQQKAVKKAWEMLGSQETALSKKKSELKTLLKNTELNQQDVIYIMDFLKKDGFIKSYVLTGSQKDINSLEYVLNFWTREKSKYLKEQARAEKITCTNVLERRKRDIKNYWKDILEGKLLSELTKADIDICIDKISKLNLSFDTKNKIIESVTKPLGYAYKQDLMEQDISKKWVRFSGTYKKRSIFPPEIKTALFSKTWHDTRAKVAFMLSMTTGMRSGEVLALRGQDVDFENGRIYVRHSWSIEDGLKSTKNGDERIAVCPFELITGLLKGLLDKNPYDIPDDEKFIFWGTLKDKPVYKNTLLKSLRHELKELGMSDEEVKKYTFHSCRHDFITTLIHNGANMKAVQSNVGHRTIEMTEHYSNHALEAERKELEQDLLEQYGKYFMPKVIGA